MAWLDIQEPTHYEVLEVPQSAALEDIRAAYRAALLRQHPDKTGSRKANPATVADADFARMREAWEVLKDAATKALYDKRLKAKAQGRFQMAVSSEVDLGDMDIFTGEGTNKYFTHPCRCGGRYLVEDADLSFSDSEVLVQCQTCSLVIRVLYSVAS